jgi:hypothetical protein
VVVVAEVADSAAVVEVADSEAVDSATVLGVDRNRGTPQFKKPWGTPRGGGGDGFRGNRNGDGGNFRRHSEGFEGNRGKY